MRPSSPARGEPWSVRGEEIAARKNADDASRIGTLHDW
jgi:hypothetical protein